MPRLSAGLLATVLLGCVLTPSVIAAERDLAQPDFSPNRETGWLPVGDDFLPPSSGPGPVTFDKRHPYVDNLKALRTNTQPSYRVADLSNPILQPWAVEQMRKANEDVLAGKVPFRPRESCYPGGVPGFLVYNLNTPTYILQTPTQVTVINPDGPELRRIYLNAPHSPHVVPSWYGESVGHYEAGSTLVVDTIGLSTKAFVDNYRTPHTEALHVVERYTLIESGKTLEVLITVDDPGAFTTAWSAIQRFHRVQRESFPEHICAENNINPFNFDVVPTPHADRADF